jgi:hypothetical protein
VADYQPRHLGPGIRCERVIFATSGGQAEARSSVAKAD